MTGAPRHVKRKAQTRLPLGWISRLPPDLCKRGEAHPVEARVVEVVDEELRRARVWRSRLGKGHVAGLVALDDRIVLDLMCFRVGVRDAAHCEEGEPRFRCVRRHLIGTPLCV